MGNVNGRQGVWAYVEGGMGRISSAIAERAMQAGAVIMTDAQVGQICILRMSLDKLRVSCNHRDSEKSELGD